MDTDGKLDAPRRRGWPRLLALAVLLAVAGAVWAAYGDALTLQNLADREAQLRQFQVEHPWLTYSSAFALYVAVTGLSLPGATVLSLAYGWFFGLLRGTVLVSFASTSGATVAFLLSRYLLRDAVMRRFGERLDGFLNALQREGAYYLFSLRLIPLVPFFVINVVMGLTPLPAWKFWWVSQLGMLPGTVVYLYAGASVPDLQTLADRGLKGILQPELIVAFTLLGLFPIVVKRLAARFARRDDVISLPQDRSEP